MIYFSLSNSLQLQYDGLLTKLKGNFVSKEVYLLDGNALTALGRPFSVCISLKDGEISEVRAFEQWHGIESIMNSDLPMIMEGTLMGELMRYLLMRLRRVLQIEPYANEHMLSVLRAKLNDKFKYYNVYLVRNETLVSDMRLNGAQGTAENVLRVVSEPSLTGEALKDMDLSYMARLMGLCRYEEAAALYEEALSRVDVSSIIGTELAICLAETYYFMDRYEDSAAWYLKCDGRYIKNKDDYKLRLGHSLMAIEYIKGTAEEGKEHKEVNKIGEGHESGEININAAFITYYKGILNPTYIKYNREKYDKAEASVKLVYDEYRDECIKMAQQALDQSTPVGKRN